MCGVLRAMFRWLKCTATPCQLSAASLVCHDLTDGSDGAGAASGAGAARTGSFHRECFDAEKIPNII